ncbi:MAG: HepT-like ribonuclease domain-containing protein [Deltaproteobacteria bacterium]
MKQRDLRKYLYDMKQACELLLQFTAGKTFTDYSADPILRSAVERQFEIVGEALAQALRLDPDLVAKITNTARIIAFRNRLIHGCASIADGIVWGILEANLPTLYREVSTLLKDLTK